MDRLARFDTFRKSKDHVQVRTLSGATVSVATFVLVVCLFFSELVWYRTTRVENHLMVDTSQGDRDLEVSLDISFHALKCDEVDFRVEDSKGVLYDDLRVHMTKTPVTAVGGDASYMSTGVPAGCRIVGTMSIKRVTGNFHVAPPRPMFGFGGFSFQQPDVTGFNASHTIRRLAFGAPFPGQVAPLDGHTPRAPAKVAMYQYHVKVVPTLYERLDGTKLDSDQFSATDFILEYSQQEGGSTYPGVWFRYDFSPIMVRLVEKRHGVLEFLVSVCALLGGAFAISGIVDQVLYRSLVSRKLK